jgi:hypothetical protein
MKMDSMMIEGIVLVAIVLFGFVHAMSEDKPAVKHKEPAVEGEEPVIDPGVLGNADGEIVKPSIVHVGIAKLDIKHNAEGLVEFVKGIPVALIPNGTTGMMAQAIRDFCRNGKSQMNRAMSYDIASKIKDLRSANKTVSTEEDQAEKSRSELKAS